MAAKTPQNPNPRSPQTLEQLMKHNRRMYERWLTGWTRDVLVYRAVKKQTSQLRRQEGSEAYLRNWSDAKLSALLEE